MTYNIETGVRVGLLFGPHDSQRYEAISDFMLALLCGPQAGSDHVGHAGALDGLDCCSHFAHAWALKFKGVM